MSTWKFSACSAIVLCCATGLAAQEPLTDREKALLERIDKLEQRLAALERKTSANSEAAATARATATSPEMPRSSVLGGAATGAAAGIAGAGDGSQPDKNSSALGFASGSTLNFYFDGYYGYNFNRPVGRVNLLRANDVLANNFTLNQVGLILERAPDVAAGRRYGGRVDLMFGQNTETLQGGAQNEPRPQAYRNVFQAYGTYIFPAGSGLTVDFGKFYSSLGYENNYAYDEVNYSRSFYFNYLPYYHMGFRTTYNVNSKLSVQHWLVNGANQTEDFNGFKSNAFLFTIKPNKNVSWNINYYLGEEGRDLVPALNPGVPSYATEPGLSVTPALGPKLNGRTHVIDTYASWTPTTKATLAAEFDDVIGRSTLNSAPSRVMGGAGYLKYQFTPKFNLAGRYEYLGDYGGLFSNSTQTLQESTFTATYQPAEGVQMRLEFRRDASDHPYFLTAAPGVFKKEQNTATLGMIWWFGSKRDSW